MEPGNANACSGQQASDCRSASGTTRTCWRRLQGFRQFKDRPAGSLSPNRNFLPARSAYRKQRASPRLGNQGSVGIVCAIMLWRHPIPKACRSKCSTRFARVSREIGRSTIKNWLASRRQPAGANLSQGTLDQFWLWSTQDNACESVNALSETMVTEDLKKFNFPASVAWRG